MNTVKNWEHEFEKWLPGDLELDVHEMSVEKDNWGRADRLSMWRREGENIVFTSLQGVEPQSNAISGGIMIMGYDMFRNLTNEQTKKFTKKQKGIFKEALVEPGPGDAICFNIQNRHTFLTRFASSQTWSSATKATS